MPMKLQIPYFLARSCSTIASGLACRRSISKSPQPIALQPAASRPMILLTKAKWSASFQGEQRAVSTSRYTESDLPVLNAERAHIATWSNIAQAAPNMKAEVGPLLLCQGRQKHAYEDIEPGRRRQEKTMKHPRRSTPPFLTLTSSLYSLYCGRCFFAFPVRRVISSRQVNMRGLPSTE